MFELRWSLHNVFPVSSIQLRIDGLLHHTRTNSEGKASDKRTEETKKGNMYANPQTQAPLLTPSIMENPLEKIRREESFTCCSTCLLYPFVYVTANRAA